MRRFTQVDVFTDQLMFGNPVAVVHDADQLTTQQMADFARWTKSQRDDLSVRADRRAGGLPGPHLHHQHRTAVRGSPHPRLRACLAGGGRSSPELGNDHPGV